MKTKTWMIGESCEGGIIAAEIHGQTILLFIKEWDYSKFKTTDQPQPDAKVLHKGSVIADQKNVRMQIMNFLEYYTTYFHANNVLDWIETQVELRTHTYTSW